jgi:hypothetical protein
MYRFRSFGRNIFVCVTLIGVKSKYGSGWGTSPGLMNINDTPKKKKSLCKEHKLLSIYMVQIHKHLCKEHKLLVIYMVQIHKQAHKKFMLSISHFGFLNASGLAFRPVIFFYK